MKAICFTPKHKLIICTGKLPSKSEGRRFMVGLDGKKIETNTADSIFNKTKILSFIKDIDGED